MCGFIGVISSSGPPRLDEPTLRAMRDTMTYRGPDDAGLLFDREIAFAHRRLSIRDLASPPQPWISDDKRFALIYNGELYDTAPLKSWLNTQGFQQKTTCDTELLMQAFQADGPNCLSRLRGMFAFAIYDFHKRSLFAARDRFGIKPLFYTQHNGELIVSSTLKAILTHPQITPRPNHHALSHYLMTLRATLGRQTLFDNIFQLQPGESLTFQSGELRISTYYQPPLQSLTGTSATLDELAVDFYKHFSSSLAHHTISDVPVGAFLSGGVDSNTLVALLNQDRELPLFTRSVGCIDEPGQPHFRGTDVDIAQFMADHLGCQHASVLVTRDEYLEHWQDMVQQLASPLTTPSDVLIYRLAHDMKKNVGVALGGEGADELLCGYTAQHWSGHDYDRLKLLQKGEWTNDAPEQEFLEDFGRNYGTQPPSSLVDFYFLQNSLISRPVQRALWKPELFLEIQSAGYIRQHYNSLFDPDPAISSVLKIKQLLQRANLEALLYRLDYATMLASLEARVPYADHVLAQATSQYAWSELIQLRPDAKDPCVTSLAVSCPKPSPNAPRPRFPPNFKPGSPTTGKTSVVTSSKTPYY